MPEDDFSFDNKLQGRTLQVYLYLLRKNRPIGIRELQRDLGLSSPSVAEYQIAKLVSLGIADRDIHGRALLVKRVKVRALGNHIGIGTQLIIPRISIYALIFTAVTCAYVVTSWNSINLFVISLSSSAAGIFWFETLKTKIPLTSSQTAASNRSQIDLCRHFWHSLAPGVIALGVFIAASAFLYYYPVEPHLTPIQTSLTTATDPTAEPSPMSYSSSPSVDYSAQMSALKVQQAGPSDRLILSPKPELYAALALSGMTVIVFIGLLMTKYRHYETRWKNQDVLTLEHISILSFGTQDYRMHCVTTTDEFKK